MNTRILAGGRKAARGITLVELMVGIAVGLLVLLTVLAIYTLTLRASADTLASARLNQDLRAMMLVLSSDLRRAGYWNQNANAANPFAAGTEGGLVVESDCVLFQYDRDNDGAIGADEAFGFRLSNNAIQMRASAAADCAASTGWTTILGGAGDPLTIESLTFTRVAYDPAQTDDETLDDFRCFNQSTGADGGLCTAVVGDAGTGDTILQVRRVRVQVVGELNSHRMTLNDTIRVRNDRRFRKTAP